MVLLTQFIQQWLASGLLSSPTAVHYGSLFQGVPFADVLSPSEPSVQWHQAGHVHGPEIISCILNFRCIYNLGLFHYKNWEGVGEVWLGFIFICMMDGWMDGKTLSLQVWWLPKNIL